jgi:hemin uptake protein HemP
MALKDAVPAAGPTGVPARTGAAATPPRIVDSRALFGDQREVRIEHNGEWYLLRLTRLGKLILTK